MIYNPTISLDLIANSKIPNKTDVTNPTNSAPPMEIDITIDSKPHNLQIIKQVGVYSATFTHKEMWKTPTDYTTLFSAYAPGISGISYQEERLTIKRIQRDSFQFGTASNVLQNVLFMLFDPSDNNSKNDNRKKKSFNKDLKTNFERDLKTIFDDQYSINIPEESYDMYINATVTVKGIEKNIPLCQMGVGFLKIVQILAYKHLYNPKVLLIDELESHLHKEQQKYTL